MLCYKERFLTELSIGLHSFRCYRHVALQGLTPLTVICHVFIHCLRSFLMQGMSPRICFRGTNYEIYREHVAYLQHIV